MTEHKGFVGFLVGIASSLTATAFVWLLTGKNVQTAGLISMLIAAICVYMFWFERQAMSKLATSCVPFAQRVKGSQFEFRNLADSADKTLFVVGPNLNFLVKEPWIKDFIFLLMSERGLVVRFLLTNPDSPACHVMNDVAFTQTFQTELTNAITTLKKWKEEARKKSLDFHVKKADAITLSMIFVDGERANGKLLLIPIPWRVNGSQRPCFMLEKKIHAESFSSYYDSYKSLYDNVAIEI